MMQRNSIWRLIRNEIRSSSKRSNSSNRGNSRQRSKRTDSKGFWTGVSDTVFFKPHKSETLPVWRSIYKTNRMLGEMERGLYQPPPLKGTCVGSMKSGAVSAWHDLIDSGKALLTELAIHILTLVLVIVFKLILFWFFFWFLFWLIGLWLE
jgi:hypothetical protein